MSDENISKLESLSRITYKKHRKVSAKKMRRYMENCVQEMYEVKETNV